MLTKLRIKLRQAWSWLKYAPYTPSNDPCDNGGCENCTCRMSKGNG